LGPPCLELFDPKGFHVDEHSKITINQEHILIPVEPRRAVRQIIDLSGSVLSGDPLDLAELERIGFGLFTLFLVPDENNS